MKKEHIISILGILLIWQILAMVVQRTILIPFPLDTLRTFLQLWVDPLTYQSIGITLFRECIGFFISLTIALVFSILASEIDWFHRLFQPIAILAKTIPNISYIILALIWFGSEGAVSFVTFMILFPVFYNAFENRLSLENKDKYEIDLLYKDTFLNRLKMKIFPVLKYEIFQTSKTAASLGLKVGVMAEILGSVQLGIGKQLYYAKINLYTDLLIAWTFVLILLSLLIDLVINQLIAYSKKEESAWRN